MTIHILLVEDEESIRSVVSTYLTHFGYQVTTACDGVEALRAVSEARPDLILMDMGLPKLNGWQTTERLRARRDSAAIPVVALTAYALSDERLRSMNAGCDAFVAKPIDFTMLLGTIQALVPHDR